MFRLNHAVKWQGDILSQDYTVHHKVLLVITILAFISVPILKAFSHVEFSINILFISSLMAFIFILDYKAERFMKGMGLILFGIIVGIILPEALFSELLSKQKLAESDSFDITKKLDIFSNLMVFACSGAGGSILANHADKSSTDREEVLIQETVIDKTKNIEFLSKQVLQLNKRVGYLFTLVIFVSVVGAVIVAI